MTRKRLLCALFLLLLTNYVYAQSLTVSGEVTKPLTLQAADLAALPRTETTATDRDGKEHRYAGVALVEILRRAGTTLGPDLRGENLTKVVVVRAIDGYEVVFALPEIDPDFTSRTIMLADKMDNAPLPAGMGPFRIVVPGEKKQGRWVREVKAIEVRFAAK